MNAQQLDKTLSPARGVAAALVAAAIAATLLIVPAADAAGPCPNEAIREAQKSATLPNGSTYLPNCMALEMVTPPKKFNQGSAGPGFSLDGDRIHFSSLAALGDTPSLSLGNQYVATRGPTGWTTRSLSAPPEIAWGYSGLAIPCGFSADLSHWVTYGATDVQGQLGINTAFRGTLGGALSPIGPSLSPLSGGIETHVGYAGTLNTGSRCWGESADASRLFFNVYDATYLPGDPKPTSEPDSGILRSFGNVYEAYLDNGTPTLRLLQRDRDGTIYGGTCGAQVGSSLSRSSNNPLRGSISVDASRVYFSARPSQPEGIDCDPTDNKARIMQRTETATGPVISQLFASECTRVSPPCASTDGDDVYQGATQEGDEVFFLTSRQLADSDEDTGQDLYLYDAARPAGERLTQVSAGDGSDPTPGEGAEVLGVPDFAGDGSHVYFVARGVLTTAGNEIGNTAEAGEPNLYLYDRDAAHPGGRTVFIATLSSADEPTWSETPGERNQAMAVPRLGPDIEDEAVGGDGHDLFFVSRAPLVSPADEADGGEADVFRYDAESGSLQRVSAADPGGSDNGALPVIVQNVGGHVEAGAQNIAFGRWVSEDADTVVFETAEGLDPADTNAKVNAYVWHDGAVTSIPGASNPTVSLSGEEVAFETQDRLLPEDGDGGGDIYVAHTDGGYPIVVPPPPCQGEACQGAASSRPVAQDSDSDASRPGNPAAPKPCRKGQVKKRGVCARKPVRHKAQHRKNKRPAGHEQGGRR